MRPESELSMAKIVDIISTLQDAIISLQSSVKMLLDEHHREKEALEKIRKKL